MSQTFRATVNVAVGFVYNQKSLIFYLTDLSPLRCLRQLSFDSLLKFYQHKGAVASGDRPVILCGKPAKTIFGGRSPCSREVGPTTLSQKTAPLRVLFFCGADDGSRTHLSSLGSSHTTDVLHPHKKGTLCLILASLVV